MNNISVLRKIAKDLRMVGAHEICNKIMIAITDLDEVPNSYADMSYSYLMRELRKDDKDKAKDFQKAYKDAFDEAYLSGVQIDKIDQLALMQAMKQTEIDPEDYRAD